MSTDDQLVRDPVERSDPQNSTIEKFLDSFLQEANIKRVLLIGASIVAACSLMQVTQEWESWSVTAKYLTILAYTTATYCTAEFCGQRLGLQATSQVLRLLTLLLIPIAFLSLSWLSADSVDVTGTALTLALMTPATALMLHATDRIFKHWLQGRQLTFIASYMILCLSGTMSVINQTWLAVLLGCGFWLVMTLGVLKVNRHVFWLTEEHRWPRVFGFIPVLILGTQFVVLISTKVLFAIPIHWLGFGIVMLAATLLMTTRTIAEVFRQRTGNLVRPLPWSIIAPLVTGLLLLATGVLLSFHGFHLVGTTSRAVIPTAIVAAGLLLVVAKDTRHQVFVWFGLILLTIAYQSSPTLFGELVQNFKATAASTLNEQRLPIAFYGLTYLPLLLVFAVASRVLHNHNRVEFSVPLQRFAIILTTALVALSFTNLKAAFLVPGVSIPVFIAYAILFRDRRFVLPAIACLLTAGSMAIPFALATNLLDCNIRWSLVVMATVGLVLSATKALDRLCWLIPMEAETHSSVMLSDSGRPRDWFRLTGLIVTAAISLAWFVTTIMSIVVQSGQRVLAVDWTIYSVVSVSLAICTVRTRNYASGLWFWTLAAAAGWLWLLTNQMRLSEVLSFVAISSGVIGIAGYLLMKYQNIDLSRVRSALSSGVENAINPVSRLSVIVTPLADLATAHFIVLVTVCLLPSIVMATVTLQLDIVPPYWPIAFGLVAIYGFVFRNRLATTGIVVLAPIFAGIGVGQLYPEMFTFGHLPIVYSVTSAALAQWFRSRIVGGERTMFAVCVAWMCVIIVIGFAYISPIALSSSLLSIASIYWVGKDSFDLKRRTEFAILASAQAIVGMTMLSGYTGFSAWLPSSPSAFSACGWALTGLSMMIIFFDHSWQFLDAKTARDWSLALRAIGLFLFPGCLFANQLDSVQPLIIAVALLVLAINEFHVAVRLQIESHVVGGFISAFLLLIWIGTHDAVAVPAIAVRLAIVLAAGIALMLASRWDGHPRMGIMVRSLRIFGLVSPILVSASSVMVMERHAWDTLVILASAMIMFVHGRISQQRWCIVLSAVLLNLGIASIWSYLSWTDPQLYFVPIGLTVIGLVEILRSDIPVKAHEPLRYVGAIMVLASPCLEILGGSWLHLVSLMLLSVLVVLMAIGLRLKALVHAGTAFLAIDLVAMVIRSSIDNPGMLWITGIAIGGSVIAIAAICERNREQLLSRIRVLSAELATWH